jgi:HPr kinase/phosphorylase
MGAEVSPVTRVHGTLVEVAGVGVLLLGQSGIGKSECAIELVLRGWRFVADDVVLLHAAPPGGLIGEGPELVRHHVELRGIGIVHLPSLFGAGCVADSGRVELIVELVPWGRAEVERVGIEGKTRELSGIEVPCVQLPVAPGRNVATLVEVAAREFRRRQEGNVAASALDARILESMRRGEP